MVYERKILLDVEKTLLQQQVHGTLFRTFSADKIQLDVECKIEQYETIFALRACAGYFGLVRLQPVFYIGQYWSGIQSRFREHGSGEYTYPA